MTHEEAINTLKVILEEATETEDSICYVTSGDADALKAAIKALEQQPSEDCISREEVRRVLGNEVFELMKIHTTNSEDNPKADAMAYGVNWSLNTLMELPFVTPSRPIKQEPRQGHWIKVTNGRGGHECDVCHDYAPSFQNGDEYLSAFCPNCGADMRESEEEE